MPPTIGMKLSTIAMTMMATVMPSQSKGDARKMRHPSDHHAAPRPALSERGARGQPGVADALGVDAAGTGGVGDALGNCGSMRVSSSVRRASAHLKTRGRRYHVSNSRRLAAPDRSMEALLADLARHGVPLVGLNVFLQQLGLPIPAVPTMMVAGALAADGRMLGGGVFGISVLASVVADALWFVAGRRYGYPVLRTLCRVSLSPDTCVRQTEGIFERYGFYSLIVSKFVPGFSTVAPPMAGALRMSFGRFLAASIASAALWVGAAMMVGLLFAAQIEAVLTWIARHGVLAGVAIGAALAGYVVWKAVQRWRLARFVEGTRIEAGELAQALSHDEPPLVVDIGSSLAQQSRPHLPGALLIDLDAVASHAFPRDRAIVFYCACPNEASAKRATQMLLARGYENVRPLVGGLDGWIAAGLPVESRSVTARVAAEARRAA